MTIVRALLLAVLLALPLLAAEPVTDTRVGITAEPIAGWTAMSAEVRKGYSAATAKGVAAHAAARGIVVAPDGIESRVIACYLHEGTDGDLPNVILAAERIWGDPAGKTGLDYIALLEDRFALLAKHNAIEGAPRAVRVGGHTFHAIDVVNRRMPSFPTRQEYLCTAVGDYYVAFTLSYNDRTGDDYRTMMAFVQSYRETPVPPAGP
jgi:hypothetical protein